MEQNIQTSVFSIKDVFFIVEPIIVILSAWFLMDKRVAVLSEKIEKAIQSDEDIKKDLLKTKDLHASEIKELRLLITGEIQNLRDSVLLRIDKVYDKLIEK